MSLKDVNKIPLFLIALANLTLFILLAQDDPLRFGEWATSAKALQAAIPTGVGLILIGVLNAQIPGEAKARLIFAKWNHPLPSSEAFSHFALSDGRIDVQALKNIVGAFPLNPREQSSLWYKLFKSLGDDASVVQAHREFLFTRDYACVALMLALVIGPIALVQVKPLSLALSYWGLLAIQFILTARASRAHARRLVTTVLALKAAGK